MLVGKTTVVWLTLSRAWLKVLYRTNMENKEVHRTIWLRKEKFGAAPQKFSIFHGNNFLGEFVKFRFDPDLQIFVYGCDA